MAAVRAPTDLPEDDEEELLLLISGMGMSQQVEGGSTEYWVGEGVEECVSDLQRYMRRDDPFSMPTHRASGCGAADALGPRAARKVERLEVAFDALKVVVKLTMKPEQLGAKLVRPTPNRFRVDAQAATTPRPRADHNPRANRWSICARRRTRTRRASTCTSCAATTRLQEGVCARRDDGRAGAAARSAARQAGGAALGGGHDDHRARGSPDEHPVHHGARRRAARALADGRGDAGRCGSAQAARRDGARAGLDLLVYITQQVEESPPHRCGT